MQKKDLRSKFREKRMNLSPQDMLKMDDLILIQFQSAPLPFITTLLSYWPIEENNEPDTHQLTEFLKFRNPELTVCYPVSDFETGVMQAVITDIDTPFTKQELNIFEPGSNAVIDPSKIEIVFVPLLAFDEEGYRVGYGKGFYDKYLSNCEPHCIKIGFNYFEPVEKIQDRHEFDIPLDMCITPQNVYVF